MIAPEKASVYFASRVLGAANELNYPLPPAVSMYLVDLLENFIVAPLMDEPLAHDYVRAIKCSTSLRIKYFKLLGDKSLVISGVWPKSLARKPVNISYYVSMGKLGYTNVATIFKTTAADPHFASLYDELASNFAVYRRVVEKASGAGAPKTRW